jgi:hypothetical protein
MPHLARSTRLALFALFAGNATAFAQAASDAKPPESTPPIPPSDSPAPPPSTVAASTIEAPASPAPKVNPESPIASGPVPLKGKWATTLYGFAELDAIHDSTQSFQEPAGNGAVQRDGSFGSEHGRTMFGIRNSRIGFKINSPDYDGVKASGIVEMDFTGNQPSNPPATTEAAFFNNSAFRVRHMAMKLETPVVDLLFGQYWELFGWQSYFHPNTVQIQGVPGEIFSRTPQARVSKTIKTEPVNVDIAIAASRPPQRDAELPDGQAGLRLMVNGWKGLHTAGSTGTSVDALALGVSGAVRRFVLPALAAAPASTKAKTGWGVSIDALLPIIPASMENRANALTFTGSFVTGTGISDLYAGLTGGLPSPSYPAPAMGAAIAAPVDPGLVEFDAGGGLHTIDWTSYILGLQYYLPPAGKIWVAANYSHMKSGNIDSAWANTTARVFKQSEWFDGNLFWDATPAARFGVEYAHYRQTYGDGVEGTNHRVQFSSFYLF